MLSAPEYFKILCRKKKVKYDIEFWWDPKRKCWMASVIGMHPSIDKVPQIVGHNKMEVAFNIGNGWFN